MRLAKKHTAELIAQLRKEHKFLKGKDVFLADILGKILKESEWRLKIHQWEVALEHSIEKTYKYHIPLRPHIHDIIKKLLDIYERPDWNGRGPDEFGAIYEKLKMYYGQK